jgi:tetratricopeptide (TPR) repeat protein
MSMLTSRNCRSWSGGACLVSEGRQRVVWGSLSRLFAAVTNAAKDHRLRVLLLVSSLLSLVLTTSLTANDTVTIRSAQNDQQRRVTGTVIDYTGESLLLQRTNGREEKIPSERIVEVIGDWKASHEAANVLFTAGDFEGAEAKYREALRDEDRRWVQRRVLAQLTWCYRSLGKTNQAAKAFLPLYRDDPQTPYFAAIPVTWTNGQADRNIERQADTWMQDKNSSAARLIGASWSLTLSRRAEAIKVLREFVSDADPRIVFLAEAQLWRTQVATSRPDDLSRWETRIEKMPIEIRGGPHYVLGLALSRHAMHEQAALHFMRTVILYPSQRDLIPASLLAAARELETIDQSKQATGLYREILTNYETSQAAMEAEREVGR